MYENFQKRKLMFKDNWIGKLALDLFSIKPIIERNTLNQYESNIHPLPYRRPY